MTKTYAEARRALSTARDEGEYQAALEAASTAWPSHHSRRNAAAMFTETITQNPTTVEVRIRSEEHTSDESVYLCTAPLFMLDAIIAEIKKWGVYTDNDGDPYLHASGQFAITDEAFFEIILTADADA